MQKGIFVAVWQN